MDYKCNKVKNGKLFEEKTNHETILVNNLGFTKTIMSNQKCHYHLSKTLQDRMVVYTLQQGFRRYIKSQYGINIFRYPDEAYIIEYMIIYANKVIKILEKKSQSIVGSTDVKLWAGGSIKREYELVFGPLFKIEYAFCVNNYLKKRLNSNTSRFILLNKILAENNISILFGDDEDYFSKLHDWIMTNNS